MNPTFNLPDFTDGKSPIGVGTNYALGTNTDGAAPNITGEIYNTEASSPIRYGSIQQNGALFLSREAPNTMNLSATGSYSIGRGLGIDASRSSSVYGANNTTKVVTSGTAVYICIRF